MPRCGRNVACEFNSTTNPNLVRRSHCKSSPTFHAEAEVVSLSYHLKVCKLRRHKNSSIWQERKDTEGNSPPPCSGSAKRPVRRTAMQLMPVHKRGRSSCVAAYVLNREGVQCTAANRHLFFSAGEGGARAEPGGAGVVADGEAQPGQQPGQPHAGGAGDQGAAAAQGCAALTAPLPRQS